MDVKVDAGNGTILATEQDDGGDLEEAGASVGERPASDTDDVEDEQDDGDGKTSRRTTRIRRTARPAPPRSRTQPGSGDPGPQVAGFVDIRFCVGEPGDLHFVQTE
ncbi:MAG: hypothetical protein R2854_10595 [Caldilineaceae bacterium]